MQESSISMHVVTAVTDIRRGIGPVVMDEGLQRIILDLLATNAPMGTGAIRSKLNGFPMGLDVGVDEVTQTLNALLRQGKIELFGVGEHEGSFALKGIERSTDFELNRDISITATTDGRIVKLVFRVGGHAQTPISLSRAEAIKVAGDVKTKGCSDAIPYIEQFSNRDAAAFTQWLVNFMA